MKNYLVKAIIKFDDYEGNDITKPEFKKARQIDDIFYCTKERYEYLKDKNAVLLMGIDEIKEEKETKPKAKKKKSKE